MASPGARGQVVGVHASICAGADHEFADLLRNGLQEKRVLGVGDGAERAVLRGAVLGDRERARVTERVAGVVPDDAGEHGDGDVALLAAPDGDLLTVEEDVVAGMDLRCAGEPVRRCARGAPDRHDGACHSGGREPLRKCGCHSADG